MIPVKSKFTSAHLLYPGLKLLGNQLVRLTRLYRAHKEIPNCVVADRTVEPLGLVQHSFGL